MATATAKIRSFDLQVSTYTAVGASCRVCMLIEHACRPQYTGTHVNSVDGLFTPHRSWQFSSYFKRTLKHPPPLYYMVLWVTFASMRWTKWNINNISSCGISYHKKHSIFSGSYHKKHSIFSGGASYGNRHRQKYKAAIYVLALIRP